MDLRTLSVEEVLQIHEYLVQDFAGSYNPLEPPGVRSISLLSSAVGRQFTSIKGQLKYPDALGNVATLVYGLCNDHPFHNGNKRTALVSMLVHLDKNKLVLRRTRDKELFDLILAVAMHSIALTPIPRRKVRVDHPNSTSSDEEVRAIKKWLEGRAERIRRGERQVTYRQLRSILEEHGYSLDNPKGNYIDIVKIEEVIKGLFKRRTEYRKMHIGKIGYPSAGEFVPLKELKHARRLCRLTEECGVDSDSFYEQVDIIDSFINKYRTVLRRLAAK